MPKQVTVTAYTFDELSEAAKQKAREWMRMNFDDWYYQTEEDAEQAGLKLTAWDLGRGSYCTVDFVGSPENTASLIQENHGDMCDTWKAASAYVDRTQSAKATITDADELETALENAEAAFQNELGACYLQMLRDDKQDKLYGEGLDETIRANEYLFTEDGKRTHTL